MGGTNNLKQEQNQSYQNEGTDSFIMSADFHFSLVSSGSHVSCNSRIDTMFWFKVQKK